VLFCAAAGIAKRKSVCVKTIFTKRGVRKFTVSIDREFYKTYIQGGRFIYQARGGFVICNSDVPLIKPG